MNERLLEFRHHDEPRTPKLHGIGVLPGNTGQRRCLRLGVRRPNGQLQTWTYFSITRPFPQALVRWPHRLPADSRSIPAHNNSIREQSTDPARLGADLTAFNTSTLITPNLSPSRYQINSVTFKATWTYNFDTATLYYTTTPISQPEMLAEVAASNVTSQKPFELYGVGFRNGYTGYEFDETPF